MTIYSSSAVDVVGDVVGYYSKPVATALQCVVTGTSQIAVAAGATAGVASPNCAAGYTPVATFCDISAFEVTVLSVSNGCAGKNNTTTSQNIFASQRCCQIPGR
jgi:hypothetical protein